MKAIHINAKTGHEMRAHGAAGLASFCSWRRLEEVMRSGGEVRPTEDLLSYQLDDRGITIRMRTRDSK